MYCAAHTGAGVGAGGGTRGGTGRCGQLEEIAHCLHNTFSNSFCLSQSSSVLLEPAPTRPGQTVPRK